MVKTIAAVHCNEVLVNSKSIEHRAAEVDRLVGKNREFAVPQPAERITDAWIKGSAVKHVSPVVGEEHLQASLDVRFSCLWPEGAADQHQSAVSDETCDLFLRQNRQVKLISNVVDGCRQVLFRIDQGTVKIKDENGPHWVIIASVGMVDCSGGLFF